MAIESDGDRRMFVEEDEFAVSVAWVHQGDTAVFSAIFDDSYQLITTEFVEDGAEGSAPQLMAVTADVPAAGAHGDAVTIGGKAYSVVEFKPDRTGMTIIRLQEA